MDQNFYPCLFLLVTVPFNYCIERVSMLGWAISLFFMDKSTPVSLGFIVDCYCNFFIDHGSIGCAVFLYAPISISLVNKKLRR